MGMTGRRRHARLLLAALAVAALVALAWAQWRQDHAQATLLTLDPAAISRISIRWQGQPARHYVHRDGQWRDADDPDAGVDAARLARLARLAATPVLQWRHADSMDATRIGLAQPALRVTLDDEVLEWGSLTALGPQRFVRVGRRIAIVPAAYSPRPPGDSSQKS